MRVGRYGPFLQRGEGGAGNTATLPKTLPPADLTVEKALALLKAKAEGPRSLGPDPATGLPVYVQHGRFGHYVQLGETPEKVEGQEARDAEARVDSGDDQRVGDHAGRGAAAAQPAARARRRTRATARSSSRTAADSGRT